MFKKAILAAAVGATAISASAAFAQTTVYQTTRDNSAEKSANARTGLVAGATAGAVVGGPVGAVVGAAIGATGGNQLTPDEKVVTYVQTNPVAPVIIEGDIAAGYVVPETVTLTPVPDTNYAYIYSNDRPVLVNPADRTVIRVIQ